MNPLKYKKQWEKQWTKGRDRGVLNRHPRSASGSLNSGDSSSSSISSSPSPQYSPEISHTETELNNQPDAPHNFGKLHLACLIPMNYSIEANIKKCMEGRFPFKDPRIYRGKEQEEIQSDEDTQHRYKPETWWKKEKGSQSITINHDAQEHTETIEEISKESSCSPESGTETQTNDISCSPRDRKVTSFARNRFSSSSPTPPNSPHWPSHANSSNSSIREEILSMVKVDNKNSTFNEVRDRNDVGATIGEHRSTEMSTAMHKEFESHETFNAEDRNYQHTASNGSSKRSSSWLDSTNTKISEDTGKDLREDYNYSLSSPPPLSLIHSDKNPMPPLEPVRYSDMPPLARNDFRIHTPERENHPDRSYKTSYEYNHQTINRNEGGFNGMKSNELQRNEKREDLKNGVFAHADPRTKLIFEALRRKSINDRQDLHARNSLQYHNSVINTDVTRSYYTTHAEQMPSLKQSISLPYPPDIVHKQYSGSTRIHTPPYQSNEISPSKRTKHHSSPDDVDKYKEISDNQFPYSRRDFYKHNVLYPPQSNINSSIPLIERIFANQNHNFRTGYSKILQNYRHDSAGSELNKIITQKETDIDVQGGHILQSKKGRLDPGNYAFSIPDYRENNEEENRLSMSQTKKHPFHQLTSTNQTHSIALAQEKKPNETKSKSATEGSSKQDVNLREDIEQLYMNKFQTTPKNQPITLDFNGIDVTITGFQLIYSNSEDFKNIICNYPQHVQGHLKEMRRKMKNRDAAKRSRSKRDGRLYQLRHDKSRNAEKLARIEKMVEKINKLKEIKRGLLKKKHEKSRFSVNSFNEFISQNEKNKSLWDRNEVHSSEGFFKTTTSINTAGKSRCSNAVEVAENIIAAEQKHLTNTESAKSFNVNSYKEMNH